MIIFHIEKPGEVAEHKFILKKNYTVASRFDKQKWICQDLTMFKWLLSWILGCQIN